MRASVKMRNRPSGARLAATGRAAALLQAQGAIITFPANDAKKLRSIRDFENSDTVTIPATLRNKRRASHRQFGLRSKRKTSDPYNSEISRPRGAQPNDARTM